jgi:predicted MFS family arabinose efflux permease
MFFYSVLATRINTHKLLIVSAFSFFLKALATLLVPSIGFLFAIQILQMPAFGLYAPTAVHFSDHSVSDADRIRSQAIAMVAGIGIGNVIGNLGGGFVLDIWGLERLLQMSTILAAIGFIIMFIVLLEKSPRSALE